MVAFINIYRLLAAFRAVNGNVGKRKQKWKLLKFTANHLVKLCCFANEAYRTVLVKIIAFYYNLNRNLTLSIMQGLIA